MQSTRRILIRLPLLRGAILHAIIIEKDYLNAQLIKRCLMEMGYRRFSWADTASDAVAAVHQCLPDLITADVHLREEAALRQ